MKTNSEYSIKPSYLELCMVILTGAVHIFLELISNSQEQLGGPESVFNIIAVIGWSIYVLWRAISVPGMARAWGWRRDNFPDAMKLGAIFAAPAVVVLLIIGWLLNHLPIPSTFWLVLFLYPVWGIAQQFALQALITKNLRELVKPPWLRALAAATLFSVSHFPNYILMALTFPAGFIFTFIYEKKPNIWAIGIVHGLLGALAFYLILGEDPGALILNMISGM